MKNKKTKNLKTIYNTFNEDYDIPIKTPHLKTNSRKKRIKKKRDSKIMGINSIIYIFHYYYNYLNRKNIKLA